MTKLSKTDGRKYNRKSNRDLNDELNVWCSIPGKFQNNFKKLPSGKWLINIPELYFVSDTFDTLRLAVSNFVKLNSDFEHSDELKIISKMVNK